MIPDTNANFRLSIKVNSSLNVPKLEDSTHGATMWEEMKIGIIAQTVVKVRKSNVWIKKGWYEKKHVP